ncbi:hypothetical protein BDV98DRAFT_569971 [Pterulicium gracile]|uniref:Uncharacterized protein n=1 Tax=Pterulicium gracile TaxID=1884261 RepID=A0A5C3QIQ0_9AGAR|nr:hypothetical protein BDV98DRAFT_569971 [Pterula gracilis]
MFSRPPPSLISLSRYIYTPRSLRHDFPLSRLALATSSFPFCIRHASYAHAVTVTPGYLITLPRLLLSPSQARPPRFTTTGDPYPILPHLFPFLTTIAVHRTLNYML